MQVRLEARPRVRILALGLMLAAPLFVECGGDDGGSPAKTTSPYDDDSERLAHCEFEPAPVREAGGVAKPAPLKAGYATGRLELPIGAPMGGYGARSTTFGGKGASIAVDARAPRFATRFIPSVGTHDVPRIDAIALESDGEKLVILRVDAVLVTETVLFAIEQALAPDGSMRGRVIVTASHSHSSWSNWLPSLSLVPGIDTPRKELFERAVTAHADVARAALAAMEPARIGFKVDPHADPDDAISHDRRPLNDDIVGPDGNTAGKDKDHTVWALRIDRANGTPLAAMFAFPIHGTRGSEENPLASSDVPGGIQRALSESLGYPVLHVQGAAGDVSPGGPTCRNACPDGKRCLDAPNIEVVGALAAQMFGKLVSSIETRDSLALEVVTRTFYVGRAGVVTRPDGRKLYYPPPGDYEPDGVVLDDSGAAATPLDEFNAPSGAALCGESGGALVPIPGTFAIPAYKSCNDVAKLAPAVSGLYQLQTTETPICDTARATASAVRFDTGDESPLLLLTVPGEPTAPYAAYLRGRSPAGPEHTLVLGYAQDHIGYVLTAEDWLAGGYEPSINVWGPLEGEMALDGILDAAELAWTPKREDPEKGTSRFNKFPFPVFPAVTPVVTSDHGSVPSSVPPTLFLPDTQTSLASAQPESTVPRVTGAARFVWLGGDPAVDFPHVVVERESSPGKFEPLLDARGGAASAASGAVFVSYTPDPISDPAPGHHYYVATWQPVPPDAFSFEAPGRPFSLPLGHYRLSVTGRAHTASGDVDYAVVSQPFEVVAAPLGAATAKRSGSSLEISAMLADAPGLRALRAGPSDKGVPLPGPWKVTLKLGGGTSKKVDVEPTAEGKGSVKLTSAEISNAQSADVRDAAGNGGEVPVTN